MVYRGKVQNGVVVFEGSRLADGTEVRIEPVQENGATTKKPGRGSLEAILPSAGIWKGQDEEIDALLKELREMKKAEVEQQLREPEPEL